MLKNVHALSAVPHYVLGFLALLCFWVPVVARKGGKVHRVAGVGFVISMLLTALTSFLMAGAALLDPALIHPHRSPESSRVAALFLSYLGVVSVVMVHNGWAVVRLKRQPARLRAGWRVGLNVVALISAAAMLLYGFLRGAPLLCAMSPIGFLVGRSYLNTLKAFDAGIKTAWLHEHIGAMCTGGIAVHTAFIAGGGARFLPAWVGGLGWWVWLVPTAVGVPLLVRAQRALLKPARAPSA
jgi:hypothetical protein